MIISIYKDIPKYNQLPSFTIYSRMVSLFQIIFTNLKAYNFIHL